MLCWKGGTEATIPLEEQVEVLTGLSIADAEVVDGWMEWCCCTCR